MSFLTPDYYNELVAQHPALYMAVALAALALAAFIANFIVKKILLRVIGRFLSFTRVGRDEEITRHGLIPRLSNIVPAIIVIMGIELIPDLPEWAVAVVRNVASAFIVLTLARAFSAALNIANTLYMRRPDAHNKPIKGYLQVLKIAIFLVAAILIVAALIDKSPLILLSGLGAMAAVLMLVFQDTLLSLVASIQISSSDMVRVGDWIEMPQLNADGDVTDIALHTVKVRNWDMTITTLPTRSLITTPFKNWRGMTEAGGRRIKRAIYLDQNSIRFLTAEEKKHLGKFKLLQDYLAEKQQEIDEWNAQIAAGDDVGRLINSRRLTNIGTFRAYVIQYLRHHAGINQNMTMLVRQLAPGPEGLPLEIYTFTSDIRWAFYEGIQADIFDHLYSIMGEFGLRPFQRQTDYGLQLLAGKSGGKTA
ncbi:MAG: mechanosensitive ion channel domain-containing protein [Micavibrio sp.]